MTERPILFSAPMVRAILDGSKTQTRRVVKESLQRVIASMDGDTESGCVITWSEDGHGGPGWYAHSAEYPEEGAEYLGKGPYRLGDRLWVRETWHPAARLGTEYLIEYKADESERTVDAGWEGPTPTIDAAIGRSAWLPSIDMPRWASRLTLEVVGVDVERLQDITGEDVLKEGVGQPIGTPLVYGSVTAEWLRTREFAPLWDSINAKRGHSWESNPWVWVVEFKRVDHTDSARVQDGGAA